jgi:hypothetical protein
VIEWFLQRLSTVGTTSNIFAMPAMLFEKALNNSAETQRKRD